MMVEEEDDLRLVLSSSEEDKDDSDSDDDWPLRRLDEMKTTSDYDWPIDMEDKAAVDPLYSLVLRRIYPEIIEESIKSFVFQTLKMDGPMKETDQKFTKEIGPDAKALVMERRGLINLLKSDERFASYAEYICLKGDAEKAKKMMDQDTKARGSMEKKPTVNLGDMARKIREQLEKEKDPEIKEAFEGFGLAKAAQGASILDSIKKNADIGSKGPNPESRVRNNRDLGVQTDVSSLDLDELDDPIILKQTNAALLAELQESQDKLYKIQNEKKVESKEMMDRVRALSDDKNKMKSDNNNLNETIQKMNKTYRDATKKEEELRRIKDTLESEQQKSGTMKADLNNTKLKLENEQRLSFQLQSQLQSSRDQDMTAVKSLKLRCLKTEFDGKKTFLMFKNLENEKLITYLTNMNSNEANQASFSTIKSSIDKLNEFSARLYNGIETLQAKYEEKIRLVEQSPGAVPVELNFDSSSLESPQLTSIEVDTLRLLTSVSLNTRPQVAPFASYPNTTRPPPSRPPGLLGPPPGLPPRSDSNNPLPDNLNSIRAASARPRAASSPRPAVTASAARPTPTQAARPTPAAAAAAAALGPRNKAYQKLLAQLQTRYPDLTTPDVERYIHMLRENNNGKLSGMSIQSIHERVGNYMRADRERKRVENDTDNNCSICLEDMFDRDSRRLNPCEHKFHNHCINNWLSTPGGAGNTCPMCRHYIIQEDEFPDLGHSGHRRH